MKTTLDQIADNSLKNQVITFIEYEFDIERTDAVDYLEEKLSMFVADNKNISADVALEEVADAVGFYGY